MTDALLPAALAFIMFSLGLTLVPADFRRVLARPQAMAIGLLGQMVVLPLLAWAVTTGLALPADMAVGLMILAACPGGASAGLITHLARGETALSISLTAITSVAALASAPLVVDLALRHFGGAGLGTDPVLGKLVRGVFLLTTVPVALGMALRHRRPALALRVQKSTDRASVALFVLIVLAFFIGQRDTLMANLGVVGPAALTLNVGVMGAGLAGAAAAGLGRRERIAIAAECGLQNAALGIYIAVSVLARPALAVPSVVYALLMNFSAIAFIFIMRRQQP